MHRRFAAQTWVRMDFNKEAADYRGVFGLKCFILTGDPGWKKIKLFRMDRPVGFTVGVSLLNSFMTFDYKSS